MKSNSFDVFVYISCFIIGWVSNNMFTDLVSNLLFWASTLF